MTASINPGMSGDDVLLGMSFLKQLELIQRGEQLLLRQTASRPNSAMPRSGAVQLRFMVG